MTLGYVEVEARALSPPSLLSRLTSVGLRVGLGVGFLVGVAVGWRVGRCVGAWVGAAMRPT